MAKHPSLRCRQRGVTAVMTGLMAVVLFAFGGLVLDLGHLYIGKSELQNSADAAALAGAKELNNTAAGITAAVDKAIAISGQHQYNFSSPVTITIANIRVGSCPNASNANSFGRPNLRNPSCTFVPAASVTSDAAAAGLSFLEVDSGTRTLNTYLMRVAGAAYNTTSTSGYAVAGRFETLVTPIGVCAVDPANRTSKYTHSNGQTELVELGFRRGVTYNLFQLNPLASGPSDPYLINPIDAPPNACDPGHASANFTAPFICTGKTPITLDLTSGTGKVYTNTGMTASLDSSLNSRFDDYKSPSVCDPSSAPPDVNVREYRCHPKSAGSACDNSGADTTPTDWLEPGASTLPDREFVDTDPTNNKPRYALPPGPTGISFAQYGPLWSYSPAYHADGSSPPKAGTPYAVADANGSNMYHTTTGVNFFDTTANGYPTTGTPYSQTAGKYFKAPSHTGTKNRRVLNIVIVDCRTPPSGSSSCGLMTVLGVGKFFMQTKADFSGGPNRYLDTEFAGLVDPVPPGDIRLYR
ncbi:MAG TPA: pilus assembly protein TadG-related protein [Aromatoleum sp.]|uniref:pilus assembly protein TadG-related protein n=1 Tax=Aromatoleum sp. TaxID=2307007 RepID=UPI002B469747|nr:pilus assembly protein TadG-related protein [Aromatoleum sp.]HJV26054.1 pilus assembly protein TadG-related protein [Aromatoleum sp.]